MSEEDEKSIFKPEGGKLPTRESMPAGSYKFVRVGDSIIFSNPLQNSYEHSTLSTFLEGRFDAEKDDAGTIGIITWPLSTGEIEAIYAQNLEFNAKVDPDFDAGAYKEQLLTNFSRIRIRVSKEGSSSLRYKVREENRKATESLLLALFPGAVLVVD